MLLTHPSSNDIVFTSYGDIAQSVEHTAHIRSVIGSIPIVAKGVRNFLAPFLF
mgnify:CR=1 FL=1